MKVSVSSASFSKNKYLREQLLLHFTDVSFNSEGHVLSGDSLVEFIADSDAVIPGLDVLSADVLSACPNLRVISKYGVGLDSIDIRYCERNNIQILSSPGVNKRGVAEMVLGFSLALIRNLYTTSIALSSGDWVKSGGRQLTGKTIGIIGFGHVGRELASLMKMFGCDILVNDILDFSSEATQLGVRFVSKEEIYAQSDIVSLHVPLTSTTFYMIDAHVLNQMKRSAFLINTSRGSVVRQSDLKQALIDATILGAAIDVYETEPPEDLEFLSFPNLFCTPHIGGSALESARDMGLSAISNLVEFEQGCD